jgi:hypothetical protein
MELRRLVYQLNSRALPPTTARLFLMTTECKAVIRELVTPKKIPWGEMGVPSRKTPIKKPNVTRAQERRTRNEGRDERKTKEVITVKGSTSPRAT